MTGSTAWVQHFIGELRRRWRVRLALRLSAIVLACLGLVLLAFGIVARMPDMSDAGLLGAAMLALIVCLATLAIGIGRRPAAPADRDLARYVEEWAASRPDVDPLDETFVTAVEASSSPDAAGPFAPLVVDAAAARLRHVTARDVLASPWRGRSGLALAASALLCLAGLWFAAAPARDALVAARLRWDPRALAIRVEPGSTRVVTGQPLTIRAAITAAGRASSRLTPVLVVSVDGAEQQVSMRPDGDRFVARIPSVDRGFDYRVAVLAHASDTYSVTALTPPRVTRIDAHYEYPSFTRLRPRDEEDAGDLHAPRGTRVRLTVHTDKPIAGGALLRGAGASPALTVTGDRQLQADLQLTENGSYRVRLADRDGLQADDGTEYFVRLVDDRPPDVRIVRPGGDQPITPLEEVTIEARAEDDYGIASFDLVYSIAGRPERVVPFERLGGTNVARTGARLLQAEALAVAPGDVISYYARARDVAHGTPSTLASSDMFFLEVKPFNEEFVLAQSQAMSAQGDPELESLIDAQKQIIAGTWNLERRAASGQSAEDVAALAAAQRALRARVERALGQPQTGMLPFPARQTMLPSRRRSNIGLVSEAARAMGEAATRLDERRTKDAITHEMSALQALLQAQAEIRRRQILQQARGASGGGYGRQGQDMSALFDKELQRQQRTNYETRAQVEERPDRGSQDDALDRIRDLARRQEALAQRQRELDAQKQDAGTRARELEQLQREQAQLRDEAERLQRDLAAQQRAQASSDRADQPSSSGRGGAQGASSSGRGATAGSPAGGRASDDSAQADVASALEQMRQAADRLRAESTRDAAESGTRAADRLRDAERRLESGTTDGRQRAAGDLRLEAQQLAEAQRRIAERAERLDQSGEGRTDALRRLAGDKTALADRVDALQRAAEGLASPAAGSSRQAGRGGAEGGVGEVARTIEQERVAERMRSTAGRMSDEARQGEGRGRDAGREGRTSPAETARYGAAERDLASTLERIAGSAGGESGDAARASAQLDESRAIRDRLDALAREMQAASRGQEASAATGEARASGQAAGEASGAAGRAAGSGTASSRSLDAIRSEYNRELQRARDLLARGASGTGASGGRGGTPEQHEWSLSAPGNEAFKQDFGEWKALHEDVRLALERFEDGVSKRTAPRPDADRLRAGERDAAPGAYEQAIARYYESLARARK